MITHRAVVMMAGLPGTGKSTLATRLARSLGLLVIDKDLIHSVMMDRGADRAQSAEIAYEISFWLLADFVNRQDKSAIFDSAGRQPFVLGRLQNICAQARTPLKVIHCRATAAERARRLNARTSVSSQLQTNQFADADDLVFYAYLPDNRLIVDTTDGVDFVLHDCLVYLQQ
ncbi:MAG: AAA family ATPase [Ardenticatenaceae bacterium]|nr:AAA family ATPase [Ardenticatenaceae bacterium]